MTESCRLAKKVVYLEKSNGKYIGKSSLGARQILKVLKTIGCRAAITDCAKESTVITVYGCKGKGGW